MFRPTDPKDSLLVLLAGVDWVGAEGDVNSGSISDQLKDEVWRCRTLSYKNGGRLVFFSVVVADCAVRCCCFSVPCENPTVHSSYGGGPSQKIKKYFLKI